MTPILLKDVFATSSKGKNMACSRALTLKLSSDFPEKDILNYKEIKKQEKRDMVNQNKYQIDRRMLFINVGLITFNDLGIKFTKIAIQNRYKLIILNIQ